MSECRSEARHCRILTYHTLAATIDPTRVYIVIIGICRATHLRPRGVKQRAVPDLSVNLAGLKLANPTMTCSGTCGYAFEYADFMDLSQLGAFVTKSITREERPGNEPARIVETRAGMLNAIGLANVGLERFLDGESAAAARRCPAR